MSEPFVPGDRALLLDSRGRTYLVRLAEGETFHFHGGSVPHDALIGRLEGESVRTTNGALLTAVRPRLADFVLKMPRGAQVVYPKDVGAILVQADIFPGAGVLEAGTGSGSLTMALARAVGPTGRLVSYELRADHLSHAEENLRSFFGGVPEWVDLRAGDVRDVPPGEQFDRIVLDMAQPWDVIDTARACLGAGGVLAAYVPTTIQVQDHVLALRRAGYVHVQVLEMLMRTWHVEERSVRPDHRMVGHTGFLVTGRKGAESTPPPQASNM